MQYVIISIIIAASIVWCKAIYQTIAYTIVELDHYKRGIGMLTVIIGGFTLLYPLFLWPDAKMFQFATAVSAAMAFVIGIGLALLKYFRKNKNRQ